MPNILRSLFTPIVGYGVLVIGALLSQEALFGRITAESSQTALIVGGTLTTVGSVIAGIVVAWMAPRKPWWHALPLCIWLVVEATLLHLEGTSPLWFDVFAGGSNVIGVLLGVYLWTRWSADRIEPSEAMGG